MATGREINALAELIEQAEGLVNNDIPTPEEMAVYMLEHGARVLPCEIGDRVYCIRNYNGIPTARGGTVWEMYYNTDMTLSIVVKGIGRGQWGVKIFATREECEQAIERCRQ